MRNFKLSGWKFFVIFFSITLIIQVSVYAGEPVPGAYISIKNITGNQSKANTKTDGNGKFLFTSSVLKKGKYVILIKLKRMNEASTKAKKYQKYQFFFQLGKFEKSGKVYLFKKKILIPSDKLSGDKEFKAMTFELNEDITLVAPGNKGGFAIGGFSAA